jgi:hypothetical protein
MLNTTLAPPSRCVLFPEGHLLWIFGGILTRNVCYLVWRDVGRLSVVPLITGINFTFTFNFNKYNFVFQYFFSVSWAYFYQCIDMSVSKHVSLPSRSMMSGLMHGMVVSVTCWLRSIVTWLPLLLWYVYVSSISFKFQTCLFTFMTIYVETLSWRFPLFILSWAGHPGLMLSNVSSNSYHVLYLLSYIALLLLL